MWSSLQSWLLVVLVRTYYNPKVICKTNMGLFLIIYKVYTSFLNRQKCIFVTHITELILPKILILLSRRGLCLKIEYLTSFIPSCSNDNNQRTRTVAMQHELDWYSFKAYSGYWMLQKLVSYSICGHKCV